MEAEQGAFAPRDILASRGMIIRDASPMNSAVEQGRDHRVVGAHRAYFDRHLAGDEIDQRRETQSAKPAATFS